MFSCYREQDNNDPEARGRSPTPVTVRDDTHMNAGSTETNVLRDALAAQRIHENPALVLNNRCYSSSLLGHIKINAQLAAPKYSLMLIN